MFATIQWQLSGKLGDERKNVVTVNDSDNMAEPKSVGDQKGALGKPLINHDCW